MAATETLLSPNTSEEFYALNKQARHLATSLDQQLNSITKRVTEIWGHNTDLVTEPSYLETMSLWSEIKLKLDQFKAYTEGMEELLTDSELSYSDPTLAPTLHRHRERLSQFQKEANHLESKLNDVASRQELLRGTKSTRRTNREGLTEQSEAAYFITEQARLDSSHNTIDSTLGQAFELHNELNQQGASLSSSNSRLLRITSSLPGVNGLLNRISLRRRRDSMVIGSVIALGVMFLFFTSF